MLQLQNGDGISIVVYNTTFDWHFDFVAVELNFLQFFRLPMQKFHISLIFELTLSIKFHLVLNIERST